MVESNTLPLKRQMIQALEGLPDDATFDDVIERLFFVEKLHRRLAQADTASGIAHDEVRQRLAQWLQ